MQPPVGLDCFTITYAFPVPTHTDAILDHHVDDSYHLLCHVVLTSQCFGHVDAERWLSLMHRSARRCLRHSCRSWRTPSRLSCRDARRSRPCRRDRPTIQPAEAPSRCMRRRWSGTTTTAALAVYYGED